MQWHGIDHVQLAIPAGGEDAARAFWCDLLGFREVPKPAVLAVRGGAWFERGSIAVHMGVETDFRPARKAHPAFRVAGLDELRRALTEAGHPCRDGEKLPGMRRFHVDDPFGNRLEFVEFLSPEQAQ